MVKPGPSESQTGSRALPGRLGYADRTFQVPKREIVARGYGDLLHRLLRWPCGWIGRGRSAYRSRLSRTQDDSPRLSRCTRLLVVLRDVEEARRVEEAVRLDGGVGGGHRDGSRLSQVEQRSCEGRVVRVDGRGVLALCGEALGQSERDKGMCADHRTDGFELTKPRTMALHRLQGFGEKKRPERRIVAPEGLADAPEFLDRTSRLLGRPGTPQSVLEPTRQELRCGPMGYRGRRALGS